MRAKAMRVRVWAGTGASWRRCACLLLLAGSCLAGADEPGRFAVGGEAGFGCEAGDGTTVRVRLTEEFPARLAPCQRIAVFLPEMSPRHWRLRMRLAPDEEVRLGQPPGQLGVRFNQRKLWGQVFCTSYPVEITAFIPAGHLERGENVLELINPSMRPLRFEWMRVTPWDEDVETLDKAVAAERDRRFVKSLLAKAREYTELGKPFSGGKLPGKLLQMICGYPRREGRFFDLGEVGGDAVFFDPASRETTFAWRMLQAAAPLFAGTPQAIPANLAPAGEHCVFDEIEWVVARNADGVYTALVWSRIGTMPSRLTFPVDEPPGTELDVSIGRGPGMDDRKMTTRWSVVVKDGLAEMDFDMSQSVLIRVVARGKAEPPTPKLPREAAAGRSPLRFNDKILQVSAQRPPAEAIRTQVRWPNGHVGIQGTAYSTREIAATPGRIGTARNVIPWEKTSTVVDIAFSADELTAKQADGGASLYFGSGPKSPREFSFWVRPCSDATTVKHVILNMLISKGEETEPLAVKLPVGEWRRVTLPAKAMPPPYGQHLRIVSLPIQPEYRHGNRVSFEFNGFCVIGNEHEKTGEGGLVRHRVKATTIQEGGQGFDVILLGKPSGYFEYRHGLAEPVELAGISELSGYRGIECLHKRECQVLEIIGHFPDTAGISTETAALLTAQERKLCEDQGLAAVILQARPSGR